MEVLHSRCAGLDVHRDTVVACARVARNRAVEHHLETFGTTTSELERLSGWLTGYAITHVAMEATGVYWKPGCPGRGVRARARQCHARQERAWPEDQQE